MTKDMTVGSPFKHILAFWIPLFLGNMFQQVYNITDSIVVGKFMGNDALGGVGSTGALNFLVIGFVMGMTSGFGINISQAFGAKDFSKMRSYIMNSFYLCLILTIVLTLLTGFFTKELLIITDTPESMFEYAYGFIHTVFLGIVTIIAYNMFACILRALGDTRTPLYFLIVACAINVSLDLLFIIVFKWGVVGAGLATVLAQGLSALFCFIYIKKKFPILDFEKKDYKIDFLLWKDLLKIGVPMSLQFMVTAIGAVVLQGAVNSLMNSVVTATTAANRILNIALMPMDAIGITLATYAGQNLGAGKIDRIFEGVKKGFFLSMSYCVIVGTAFFFFGGDMCKMFFDTNDENLSEILILCNKFMQITTIFYPALGALFILRNTLQGLGYSFAALFAGFVELAARVYVAFGLVGAFGFSAICYSGPIAWTAAMLFLVVVYIIKAKHLAHPEKFSIDRHSAHKKINKEIVKG
ncbi:MAG: MATE family efflux transporter [Ruminococcus sp.]|jgi:putative MATE family efflux protein|nr:MATE family efflux transporter [Ruminococcus sp.]